jgi:TldD protein
MPSLRDFESDFDRLLERLHKRTPFAEAMLESTKGQRARVDRQSTRPSSDPRLQGVAVRVWGGTRWVEASTSDLTRKGLDEITESLERTLGKTPIRSQPPGVSATTVASQTTSPARPVSGLGMEGMIELATAVRGWASEVPSIRDAAVTVAWQDDERFYLNTAGARCYQNVSRAMGSLAAIAVESGKVELDFLSDGGVGGVECLDFLNQKNVRACAESARALLKAATPPTGEMTVLLDPGVAGTFAHESFGHGTEADQFVRDRSYLKPILGQNVGPEFLTIIDNGAYPGGWGTIYFDDEGHPSQRTVLVDHGKFVGALHDRETAAFLHAQPTGNTRRADCVSRPFVRMTNTYVEPGDWTKEELVKEAKDGIILERATSGIEDPLGGQMQLKVKRGHKIEKGEVTELVTSMALSGKVLDFLKAIQGVSHKQDFAIDTGFCGKGHSDVLPAGTGGTYLLSTAVVGPA